MVPKVQTQTDAALSKLQKLNTQLIRMRRDGSFDHIPFYKRASLFKRYKRYIKKLVTVDNPLSKAIALFAVAMLLSAESNAQVSCKRYKDAPESNPLKRVPLPNGLFDPAFVDIDADGDLDCYAIYRVPNSSSYDSVRFSFIKNIGTNTLPVF